MMMDNAHITAEIHSGNMYKYKYNMTLCNISIKSCDIKFI